MLIQGHDDDQLRLSDIARIEKAYEDPTRNEMFYDHERALGILIAASSGWKNSKPNVRPQEWNATKSSISPNG